ncbi:MAG TPA: transporter suffix domain-containing protein [Methanothrix sp.]|nr:transporter suffix domain-containing protein [Methanothrix sp.]HPJ83543.1 transporter suffix domain-containing protein [Methanothrix sp.]
MTSEAVTTLAPDGGAGEAGHSQLSTEADRNIKSTNWKRRLGFGLVALSCLLYGSLILVPSTSLSTEGKVALSSLLVISGEASFWIGGLILGREAVRRWKGALDPRRWIRGRA